MLFHIYLIIQLLDIFMFLVSNLNTNIDFVFKHIPAQTKQQVGYCINWSNFGAWISNGQTRTHKTHRCLNLGETTTFPFIVFFVPSHGAYTQMSFCPGTPNLGVSKLGLPRFWKPITSYENLWLTSSLKKKISSCRELFKGIWHVTCT